MRPEGRTPIPEENSHLHDGCPFLKRAQADWLWPVEGICRARMDGRLMVPPVPHYLNLCTRGEYRLCEIFRARSHAPEKAAA
jgi:hypothetical protein